MMFGIIAIIGIFFVLIFVPETKGVPMEEVESMLNKRAVHLKFWEKTSDGEKNWLSLRPFILVFKFVSEELSSLENYESLLMIYDILSLRFADFILVFIMFWLDCFLEILMKSPKLEHYGLNFKIIICI